MHTPSEPILRLPPVVKALVLLNLVVFLLQQALSVETVYALSFIPARYFGDMPFDFFAAISLVTHLFLHGGWLHLAVNLGMLMAFGAGLEQAMGVRKFLILYFLCGILGTASHLLFFWDSASPLIGASGAISGLFGGILMLLQQQGSIGTGYKKLFPVIMIWITTSVFFGFFGVPGTESNIAWVVHIGGFFAGLLLFKHVMNLKI